MSLPGFRKIEDGITMVSLSGIDSNIYLIGKDTLVDTGTGFNFVRLYDLFKKMGEDFDNIKTIINTHMHFDHVGGNKFFDNAKVLIHSLDSAPLEKGDDEHTCAGFFNGEMKPVEVHQKLKDGERVAGLRVIHTPGHTPGSVCLYDEKKKILFSGDTIFAEGVGRTDLPGGSEQDLEKSLEKLSELKTEKILCGHGEPILKDGKDVLKKVFENVSDIH